MPEMQNLAHGITLFLARLTFASLHVFEEMGVDMSEVDQAIAEWTTAYQELQAHNADLATQLVAAQATVDQLVATDAAEDAQQKADLEAQIAQQIRDALATAQNPPTPPAELPPVDNSGGEPPVPDQTLPGDLPQEPPVPVDPEAPPVPAGEVPPETPVVEVPPDTETPVELPPDAPVVPAGELPPETPVVPVVDPGNPSEAPGGDEPQVNPLKGKRR